eukprot:TRINITY_DN35499_c0_g1_i1.p1 TRINITY_DN35499_c0_g1~~TRINITY_DN35499_c0_g1_i1.p1  ORF type:complete len:797 (+),score=175.10 TRINITY_DN35499_c0_g1_i1:57-2447(+)
MADTASGYVDNEAAIVPVGNEDGARIVQLEETVINRIAAGEVVVRPANALKELLENCLDAGSTQIAVMVKAGGLKMLRIEDNGHGIRTEDLPILCERFTTSKLRKYEDLTSIGTFGFRGEALASISHVAHVTVTTMTAKDTCAHMAQYTDGKLRAPPRQCAGTRGTTLVAEDMFYNNSTRRQALAKESAEHAKVLEVVQRYAIHNPKVSFGCKKAGSGVAELSTVGGDSANTKDAISSIYGHNLASELFTFDIKSEDPKFSCKGFATGPNWTARSFTLVLFINNRLVDCGPLKRAVEAVYAPVLPRGQHPWVYMSLELDPSSIDVNVHPTKMEVQFLHEEAIAHRLQEEISAQLRSYGGSRTFATALPSMLGGSDCLSVRGPAKKAKKEEAVAGQRDLSGALVDSESTMSAARANAIAQKDAEKVTRVRTDHTQRSLENVLRTSQASQSKLQTVAVTPKTEAAGKTDNASQLVAVDESLPPTLPAGVDDCSERREIFAESQQLTSLAELKDQVHRVGDLKLSKTLNQSVYVGSVSRELILLQCGSALCLVNLAILGRHCTYQRLLRYLGGVGSIMLKEPQPLEALLKLGILDPDSGYDAEAHSSVDVDELASRFAALLKEKSELLHEYFMMDIDVDTGMLHSVPNGLGLTSDAGLNFEALPLYLVTLCSQVNWEDEKACLHHICQATAEFSTELLLPSDEAAAMEDAGRNSTRALAAEAFNVAVEGGEFQDVATAAAAAAKKRQRGSGPEELHGLRYLHEAIRRDASCLWPAGFSRDGTVIELVSLDQLYRIFERC